MTWFDSKAGFHNENNYIVHYVKETTVLWRHGVAGSIPACATTIADDSAGVQRLGS